MSDIRDGKDELSDEQAAIRQMFPAGTCIAAHIGEGDDQFLFPEEEVAVARSLPTRRNEFSIGRACAREALEQLGLPARPIPVGVDRGPLWPRGVVGTITHTRGLTAAAVAWKRRTAALGLDAEACDRPLDLRLERFICTPAERERLSGLAFQSDVEPLRVAFSAKEAVHKCVAPMSGITLNFQDVELEFDVARGIFTARIVGLSDCRLPDLQSLSGRFAHTSRYVITSAVIAGRADRRLER